MALVSELAERRRRWRALWRGTVATPVVGGYAVKAAGPVEPTVLEQPPMPEPVPEWAHFDFEDALECIEVHAAVRTDDEAMPVYAGNNDEDEL